MKVCLMYGMNGLNNQINTKKVNATGVGFLSVKMVVVVLVLLFGARRLPDLARSIGTSARELRRGLTEDSEADDEESDNE